MVSTKTIISQLILVLLCYNGEKSLNKGLALSMIINGHQATEGQFPYAVALLSHLDKDNIICTISLITARTCLGASHCSYHEGHSPFRPHEFYGLMGTIDLNNRNCLFCQKQNFSKINFYPDIATYIFEEDVKFKFTDYVKPIPLIAPYVEVRDIEVTVIGWGAVRFSPQVEFPKMLHYVNVELLPIYKCYNLVRDKSLCLETLRKGPCLGDSGGPNIIKFRGRDILVGVTSFTDTPGCAEGQSFSLDVSSYSKWIVDHSDRSPIFLKLD